MLSAIISGENVHISAPKKDNQVLPFQNNVVFRTPIIEIIGGIQNNIPTIIRIQWTTG